MRFGCGWLMGLTVLAATPIAPARAQRGGDWQVRIVYAYQTEDGNALQDIRQTLGARVSAGDDGAALRYDLAHADYRSAELVLRAGDRGADAAAGDCVRELDALLRRDPRSVEALALRSACYFLLAGRRRFESPYLRERARRDLAAAERIAPDNPRVLLIGAEQALAQAAPRSAAAEAGLRGLHAAAEGFERSASTGVGSPSWGHAEAYLALGHQLRIRGDRLGARNWIEKALLAAPDFSAARRELRLLSRE